MKNQSQEYYTPIQLKMPVDMEIMIDMDDPVYSFNEVLRHIDLGMNNFITIQGFSTISMVTVLVGAAVNIALDPVFIFGLSPQMG